VSGAVVEDIFVEITNGGRSVSVLSAVM